MLNFVEDEFFLCRFAFLVAAECTYLQSLVTTRCLTSVAIISVLMDIVFNPPFQFYTMRTTLADEAVTQPSWTMERNHTTLPYINQLTLEVRSTPVFTILKAHLHAETYISHGTAPLHHPSPLLPLMEGTF